MSRTSDEERERAEEGEPKVRFTDKRRVRPDGSRVAPAPADGEAAAQQVQAASAAEREAGDEVGGDLDRLTQEATEYRDHLLRLQAEFDNYRKRVVKEQTVAVEMASEPMARTLLEVVDDFELALIAAESTPDFESFRRGVELVFAKLADALRAAGVERMDALGAPFDPEFHEALMQEGDGDGEPVVADVLRPGYIMKGRVIRPAGVKVKKG